MNTGIYKDGTEIKDLEDWRVRAGPKSAIQWKDGRSAKESARSWLSTNQIPPELLKLIDRHPDFDAIEEWNAEPEAPVRIDEFRGEPPNIDVLVRARDQRGPLAIVVEAKADESFGALVTDTLKDADKRLLDSPKSKGRARLERLSMSLFSRAPTDELVQGLRYQLLTASGAALAEAERIKANRAVVLVHEFVSSLTEASKRQSNYDDYLRFLAALGFSEEPRGLAGPFEVPGAPIVGEKIKLYLGKATLDVRAAGV